MSEAAGAERPPGQLPLGVTLRQPRRFANFIIGANSAAVASLRDLLARRDGGVVYLWGAPGSGKSHLLEACCGDVSMHGRPVAYLPLGGNRVQPQMLSGLAGTELVCIDDVDRVAGDRDWEEALFHLYNQVEQASSALVLAAGAAPRTPAWGLADLLSRLTGAVIWRLHPLDEEGRREALQRHAREMGFALSDEVVAFVMKRLRRDMVSLTAFLERLDRSSLAAQRRVTVPFVRALLDEEG